MSKNSFEVPIYEEKTLAEAIQSGDHARCMEIICEFEKKTNSDNLLKDEALTEKLFLNLFKLSIDMGNVENLEFLMKNSPIWYSNDWSEGVFAEFGSPFHLAVIKGDDKIFKKLLEGEERIIFCDDESVDIENPKVCDDFATIGHRDNNGLTPLLLAAQCGNLKIFRYLVKKIGDINKKYDDNQREKWQKQKSVSDRSIVDLAIEADNSSELLNFLANEATDVDFTSKNPEGLIPLEAAVDKGNIEVIKIILEVQKNYWVGTGNDNLGLAIRTMEGLLNRVEEGFLKRLDHRIQQKKIIDVIQDSYKELNKLRGDNLGDDEVPSPDQVVPVFEDAEALETPSNKKQRTQ